MQEDSIKKDALVSNYLVVFASGAQVKLEKVSMTLGVTDPSLVLFEREYPSGVTRKINHKFKTEKIDAIFELP